MFSRIRVPLSFLIAALVFYFSTPTAASLMIGIPIGASGLLLRVYATGILRKDSVLATTGPYAYTRNPLYLGSFLLALGFAVASANPVSATLLLVPFALIYPKVVRREEAHLEQLFGDEFRAYKKTVPRFFPRAVGPGLRASFSRSQFFANREYNAVLGFAGAAVLFVLKWAAGVK